jgi:type I restriction enzyme M protein
MSNMTDSTALTATLRSIRAKLNLTQEQLGERLGVSFATVNRWEGGSSKPQKAAREVIAALAQEAGIHGGEDAEASESPAAAAEVTRRRRGKASAGIPTTKPMEQMLWDAACSIRGEKDAAKFKDYLLPLLFLKRLSDVFDDEIDRLAEEYGDRETALEIAEGDHSLLRFYLPAEARWAVIGGREAFNWPLDAKGNSTAPRDIGEHLTKAVRAVVKQNPSLSGVIDVVDFAAERNGERDINPAKLRGVVETFSDPRYRLGLADVQPDFLGRAYEYLLRKFAEGSGQSAGEFFTPTEVGFLMAHFMRPRPGEDCHDYACGSAGLLVKLQLVARELDPTSKVPLKLTGQELQAESYAVAKMNGIIHDMQIELARGDTMINPKFRNPDGKIKSHDVVVANPMWNQAFAPDVFANDPFDRFRTTGGVTSGKGDWAWLQHTLACLNEHGRAAVVLDTGAVTRGSGSKNEDKERNIRKWFVDHDFIDGVVLLPENLFYNTTAAGVIVVLSKRKPAARKGRIVLLNASRHSRKGKPKNYLPEDHIRTLAGSFLKGEAVEGELAIITREQAEEADYNLSPSRWVAQSEGAEHRELSQLLSELTWLDQKAAEVNRSLAVLLAEVAR